MGDIGIDRRIILKWNLSWLWGCRLDWSGSGQHLVMSLCEYDIEILGSIKALHLLSGSVNISCSRRTLSELVGWVVGSVVGCFTGLPVDRSVSYIATLNLLICFKINTGKVTYRFPVSILKELFKWRQIFFVTCFQASCF